MKRTISICLAVIMLLIACSVIWFSSAAMLNGNTSKNDHASIGGAVVNKEHADAAVSSGNVAYIERNGSVYGQYASLQAAVNALGDIYSSVNTANVTDDALWTIAGKPVIYLCSNVNITSAIAPSWWSNYDPDRVRTVYIKGAKSDLTNAKITSTVVGGAIRYNAYYNLTLEDIDMDCNGGYALFWSGYSDPWRSEKSTTNMINCNISATGSSEGLVFKVTGNQNDTDNKTEAGTTEHNENYIINMKNTHVTAETGVNAVFLFHHGAAGELNIDGDCSIAHENNVVSAGGDTMFMLGTNRELDINIASGAELSANIIQSKATSYAVFRTENSNNYITDSSKPKQTINIEDEVLVTLNADSSYTYPVYFLHNQTTPTKAETVANIGSGVTVKVNSQVAENGFGMAVGQSFTGGEGLIGVNLCADGITDKLYGKTVSAGAVSGEVTMTPVYVSSNDFDILDSASLRQVKGNGIRFTSYISDSLRTYLGDIAEFGTVIGLGSEAPTLTRENIVKIPQRTWANQYKTAYCAALINIPHTEKAVSVAVGGRAYMTLNYPDGQSATFYSDFDSQSNVRSLYQIATELVEEDEANLNDPAVASILNIARTEPEAIIKGLYADAVAMKSSATCNEYVLSGVSLSSAISAFEAKGYTQENVTNVNGATFNTVVLTSFPRLITIYDANGELRIMTETDFDGVVSTLNPNESTNTGVLEVVQVGIARDEYVDTGLLQTDNPLNGMCYIIKLSDGSAVIIDGGFKNVACAENIYKTLIKLGIATNEKGQYKIAAWIFSHGHGDHISAFAVFGQHYGGLTDVEYFIYNMPGESALVADYDGVEPAMRVTRSTIATYYPKAKQITPHANLSYHIGNATISMLYTPDLVYSATEQMNYFNNTALIFKISVGEQSVLFFTDAAEDAAATIRGLYNASTFKSDILQITHHGLYTEKHDSTAGTGFTWTNLEYIYNATGAKYAFLPMHSKYDGETPDRNGRYTVMYGWARSKYQISFVMNMNDSSYASSVNSTSKFTQWELDCVANGTSYTVYGYNGINMVNNGNGLTTYLGSTVYDPMATSFVIGNGQVLLNRNIILSDWNIDVELPPVPDELAKYDDIIYAGSLNWWN